MYQVFHSVKNWWKTPYGPSRKKKYSSIRERGTYYPENPGKSNLWKNDLWEEAKETFRQLFGFRKKIQVVV